MTAPATPRLPRSTDMLRDPLPGWGGKRFRELPLMSQNEVIVRLLEEIYDETLRIQDRIDAMAAAGGAS